MILAFVLAFVLACSSPRAQAPPPVPDAAPVEAAPVNAAPASAEWPADAEDYAFRDPDLAYEPLWRRLPPPEGYTRAPVEGYAAWTRALPLRPAGAPLRTYQGQTLWSGEDPRLLAVVDLDVGSADLQQCADTIIRLRAEWAWTNQNPKVGFHYTSGDLSTWARWSAGERPVIAGSKVSWVRSASPSDSRESYKSWLLKVFTYAGTRSLAKEGRAVLPENILPGDFLSIGGSPGHALAVLDVARDPSGAAVALIGEGYMPAQDLHLLRGPLQGWWPLSAPLDVPTWPAPFDWTLLRRWD